MKIDISIDKILKDNRLNLEIGLIEPEVDFSFGKVKVYSGEKYDTDVFDTIIDELSGNFAFNKSGLSVLYAMLSELIENTACYAYTGTALDKRWYVVVEDKPSAVRVAFLDLGVGIPESIRKSYDRLDAAKKCVNLKRLCDGELIAKALYGTLIRNQSDPAQQGLPMVFKHSIFEKIQNLVIISNKGYYRFKHDNPIVKTLNHNFYGTLLQWEIRKEVS